MGIETDRIHSLLKRAYQGNAWHGPSISELLEGINARQAAMSPFPGSHSIWELVNHIIAWEQIVLRRLQGESLVDIEPEQDWPPVEKPGEAEWQATLLDLEDSNRGLRLFLSELDDEKLNEMIPGKNDDVYTTIHGIIQHDLYHAGQIALLRKYCL